MKVSIDQELCIGCGTCVAECNECFVVEGDKAKVVKQECPECDLKEVSSKCPMGAIKVEE